jgi:hypothetical protein
LDYIVLTTHGRTSIFIISGIVITLISLSIPIVGLDSNESNKYYSEECDQLTPDELSKLELTNPDPC